MIEHVYVSVALMYAANMACAALAVPRPVHLARPGRRVVVPGKLADLHGPAEGTVRLPLRLFWSGDRTFDLADEWDRVEMCETVMREAASLAEVTRWLNADLLLSVWPMVYHKGVRRAWEEAHPALAAARVKVVKAAAA